MTSQCAQPTVRNLFIRVWARNSLSIVHSRGKNGKKRPGAGCPWATVRAIRLTPRPKFAQQTRLINAPMSPKVIVVALNDVTSPFVNTNGYYPLRRHYGKGSHPSRASQAYLTSQVGDLRNEPPTPPARPPGSPGGAAGLAVRHALR